MLYVLVNKEQTEVYCATYNFESFQRCCKYKKIELQIRLFNDVAIYKVCE